MEQIKSFLNEVSKDETIKSVGNCVITDIDELKESLGYGDNGWSARFAPSIITRSEVIIFGLSMPRFAIRVYIDNDKLYFANLRRLKTYCERDIQFSDRLPRESHLRHDQFEHNSLVKIVAAEILADQSSIADAFLPTPADLQHFSIIQADLAGGYGETLHASDNYSGSVYMKHIAVAGGGLCAQAVCFMATSHLRRYAKVVHGLAEITYYATNVDTNTGKSIKLELIIDGLDFTGMSTYFKLAGLNAILQKTISLKPRKNETANYELFGDALRAYVLSGMPVILPVDCERMSGYFRGYTPKDLFVSKAESIYAMNRVKMKGILKPFPYNRHAIIVVGANPQTDDFCFHDPLTKPFLTASATDLLLAAAYTDTFEVIKNHVRDPASGLASVARAFLPVTPPEVRIPVAHVAEEAGSGAFVVVAQGIINNALKIQNEGGRSLGCPVPQPLPDKTTQFKFLRLIRARKLAATVSILGKPPFNYLADQSHKMAKLIESIKKFLIPLLGTLKRREYHWVWLQCLENSIWIWDAECEPVSQHASQTSDQKRGFLRCVLEYRDSSWHSHFFAPDVSVITAIAPPVSNDMEEVPEPISTRVTPDTSIITSVSVKGIQDALNSWPEHLINGDKPAFADLYTFMQNDAMILDPLTRFPKGSVVQLMAELYDSEKEILRVAEKLNELFLGPERKQNIKIAALASFIPELVSVGQDRADVGVQALIFLVKLCRQLQRRGHPAKTLQIVSGCLCSSIWPAMNNEISPASLGADSEALSFGTSLLSNEEAFKILIDGLSRAAAVISEIEKKENIGPWLNFAIEMEPGPLHVLGQDMFGDIERILQFCQLVGKNQALSPYVGINLDISNWSFLGGIKASQLTDDDLFYRICHAHVSDRCKGNFSDAIPRVCHQDHHFTPWIELILKRIAKNQEAIKRGCPSFSNFIALELEATKSKDHIRVGHENIMSLL